MGCLYWYLHNNLDLVNIEYYSFLLLAYAHQYCPCMCTRSSFNVTMTFQGMNEMAGLWKRDLF